MVKVHGHRAPCSDYIMVLLNLMQDPSPWAKTERLTEARFCFFFTLFIYRFLSDLQTLFTWLLGLLKGRCRALMEIRGACMGLEGALKGPLRVPLPWRVLAVSKAQMHTWPPGEGVLFMSTTHALSFWRLLYSQL